MMTFEHSRPRIFATKATFPNRILISNNHIREVGIYGDLSRETLVARAAALTGSTLVSLCVLAGKQTSCYFQALAANITVTDNLCYNGPSPSRAQQSVNFKIELTRALAELNLAGPRAGINYK